MYIFNDICKSCKIFLKYNSTLHSCVLHIFHNKLGKRNYQEATILTLFILKMNFIIQLNSSYFHQMNTHIYMDYTRIHISRIYTKEYLLMPFKRPRIKHALS